MPLKMNKKQRESKYKRIKKVKKSNNNNKKKISSNKIFVRKAGGDSVYYLFN